jgi:hypothetical protein
MMTGAKQSCAVSVSPQGDKKERKMYEMILLWTLLKLKGRHSCAYNVPLLFYRCEKSKAEHCFLSLKNL